MIGACIHLRAHVCIEWRVEDLPLLTVDSSPSIASLEFDRIPYVLTVITFFLNLLLFDGSKSRF